MGERVVGEAQAGRLLSAAEAAEMLGVSLNRVYSAVETGKLPAARVKIDGRSRLQIPEPVIDAYLAKESEARKNLSGIAAEYGLSRNQFINYSRWLVLAGLRPAHTHRGAMSYDATDMAIFGKLKEFRDAGMSFSGGLAEAVREVVGEEGRRRLVAWRKEFVGYRAKRKRESRLKAVLEEIAEAGDATARVREFSPLTRVSLLGSGNERIAAAARQSLLEHLVDCWRDERGSQLNSYPVGLYLALCCKSRQPNTRQQGVMRNVSGKLFYDMSFLVKREISAVVQVGMRIAPVSGSFKSYKEAVYSCVFEYWGMVADAVREPLGNAFDASLEEFGAFAEPLSGSRRVPKEARWLAVVGARYGGGRIQTLEELGMQLGVTRERVRQIENKGLELLRSQGEVSGLGANVMEECMRRFAGAYGNFDKAGLSGAFQPGRRNI